MRDSTRHLQLSKAISEYNYTIQPVETISVSDPEFERAKQKFNHKATYAKLGYALSDNAISCLLGHKKIYEEFLKSGQSWALVLEDDVQLIGDLGIVLEHIPLVISEERPCIVQLFTRGERFVEKDPWFQFNGFCLFRFLCPPGQTAAYLINQSAANLGVNYHRFTGPADWPNWASMVTFFGVSPFLFFESGIDSRIPIPIASRFSYLRRLLFIVTGFHWLKNRSYFDSWSQYEMFLIKPILLRLFWRIKCHLRRKIDTNEEFWKL